MHSFRKLRLLFDYHGVIVDLAKKKEELSKKFMGTHIPAALMKRDRLRELGFNETNYDRLLSWLVERPYFLKQADPVHGAIEILQRLEKERHELYLVTASGEPAFQAAIEWCRAYSILEEENSVMWSVGRDSSKADFVRRFKIDVAVENDLDQLIEMIEIDTVKRILLTDVHNVDQPVPKEIIRVNSLEEAYQHIHLLAQTT